MGEEARELLLKLARSLRYRTLTPMIGEEVTVSDRVLISTEAAAFVAAFVDGCAFCGPEQKFLDGQVAKYGILDLRFTAPAKMLETDADSGVALLRELGFVDGESGEASCLEELLDDVAKRETFLLLFLHSADTSRLSTIHRMERLHDPSRIPFPVTFTVVDACVSNSSFVWMNKHFYL